MTNVLKRAFFAGAGRAEAIFRDWRHLPARRAAERSIAALPSLGPSLAKGPVLVDVAFQHPNYWLRYGLLAAALGLSGARKIALKGLYSRPALEGTLDIFGIRDRRPALVDTEAIESFRGEARRLLVRAGDADGLFRMAMPFDMPPLDLYDGLLRTQRLATVDLGHPNCETYVASWLAAVHAADKLVRETRPGLAILSHAQSGGDFYGALAQAVLRHGVDTVMPNGFFGSLFFHRLRHPKDIHRYFDVIEPEEIDALPTDRLRALGELGRSIVRDRIGGQTKEFAASLAFGMSNAAWDRDRIRREFGWTEPRPIVAMLTSTWYDFPHACGGTRFRDFRDWVTGVLGRVSQSDQVYLVVRGHPFDNWYNDVHINNVVRDLRAVNIGVLPYGIDGASIMQSCDALLTFYGSAALEYAVYGKPVMVPDEGWYHRHSFVVFPKSRDEYLDLVGRTDWFDSIDRARAPLDAAILQALRLACPAWQRDWRLDDDAQYPQHEIYARMTRKLSDNTREIGRELDTIRNWMAAGSSHYHRFKMLNAEEYLHV